MTNWGFCFLDIETTGLDPKVDEILEVGLVFVTHDLESILATYSHQIQYTTDPEQWPTVVKEMHETSGLMQTLNEGNFPPVAIAALNIEDDITYVRDGNGWEKIHLAGNSVHFDRSFLKEWMPSVEKLFHHRHLDASSFKLLAETKASKLEAENPNAHRAINDCYESLTLARLAQEKFNV